MPEIIKAQPMVSVGILSAKDLEFTLNGPYLLDGEEVSGIVNLSYRHVKGDIRFVPQSADCYVEVPGVEIGINFHWSRRETQLFRGEVVVIKADDRVLMHESGELILVNRLPIEDYLSSVISSEMSATSYIELLKAHAVISRSWVLAQINSKKPGALSRTASNATPGMVESATERIRWYDHDDHELFDVCADDHCQRYQGITRQTAPQVQEAIDATAGEVLTSYGELCDARFSKCCGGAMEQFEYCWDDTKKPYLLARRDDAVEDDLPDLTDEAAARQWIMSEPQAYCNTQDRDVLRQVLNDYDQETANFYRWQVEYDTDTLSELVARRSGIDFGRILDLQPIERGTSGRLSRLLIVGEKRTMEIGKELEIRRTLSESHLYSSAFVVEKTDTGFRLIGAGWGHGVGLCQIGAAMMAAQGIDYRTILAHYYPNSQITKDYNI